MKLVTIWLLLCRMLVPEAGRASEQENPYVPPTIGDCARKPAIQGLVSITFDVNPFYLRGDFDGDGRSDYAVAVRGPKTKRNGVLFCLANARAYLVGADQPLQPPFSNMPDDNFVAPRWEVFSQSAVAGLSKFRSNVPNPLPHTAAEAVAMIWEDGIALIYWNGKRFCWAASKVKE
jgi:hypothetical protein